VGLLTKDIEDALDEYIRRDGDEVVGIKSKVALAFMVGIQKEGKLHAILLSIKEPGEHE